VKASKDGNATGLLLILTLILHIVSDLILCVRVRSALILYYIILYRIVLYRVLDYVTLLLYYIFESALILSYSAYLILLSLLPNVGEAGKQRTEPESLMAEVEASLLVLRTLNPKQHT
jgi:hypothetical protein